MMRMLSAVFWLGNLGTVSAAQKAIHLDVGYDVRDVHLSYGSYPGNPSYFVTLDLGTPPQAIKTVLSTSTPNFNVESVAALVCHDEEASYNCTAVAFNSTASTTYSFLHNATSSTPPLARDNVNLSSSIITKQSFSVSSATNYGFSPNHLGLQPGSQTDVPSDLAGTIPGVLGQLRTQKQINSQAYSLWLNREPTSTGSLVLGGVDTTAYSGPLVALPMLSNPDSNLSYAIACTNMTITAANGTLLKSLVKDDFSLPMLVDTDQAGIVSVHTRPNAVHHADSVGPGFTRES